MKKNIKVFREISNKKLFEKLDEFMGECGDVTWVREHPNACRALLHMRCGGSPLMIVLMDNNDRFIHGDTFDAGMPWDVFNPPTALERFLGKKK